MTGIADTEINNKERCRMRYALIGCGRIAANHIHAALENHLDIIAVCDVVPERMEKLLEKYHLTNNLKIKLYTDYKKMIEENDIELVSIATESGLHAEIALYCISCRVNVIIEKPMALSIKDADYIIQATEKYGVKVCVCHQNRFNIAVQKLRTALEEERFGKLSHATIHVRWNRNKEYYKQASWRGTWKDDGGCLMNQCIHGIDLLRWMLGDEIEEVYGVTRKQLHQYLEGEDIGMAVVKFANGVIATIEGTVNIYPQNLEESLYIFGEKGSVKLGGKSVNKIELWEFEDSGDSDAENRGLEENVVNVYGNGHIDLFADMVSSIEENRIPYIDVFAGKRALELVLAIYKSQKEGRPVRFPLNDFSTMDMAD